MFYIITMQDDNNYFNNVSIILATSSLSDAVLIFNDCVNTNLTIEDFMRNPNLFKKSKRAQERTYNYQLHAYNTENLN